MSWEDITLSPCCRLYTAQAVMFTRQTAHAQSLSALLGSCEGYEPVFKVMENI